jgi:hypothetical protein
LHLDDANSLTYLGCGALHFDLSLTSTREQTHAGGGVVVETLGEGDVLDSDRVAGAAFNPLAVCRVRDTAG